MSQAVVTQVHVYVSSGPPWAIIAGLVGTLVAGLGGVLVGQYIEGKRSRVQQLSSTQLAAAARLRQTYLVIQKCANDLGHAATLRANDPNTGNGSAQDKKTRKAFHDALRACGNSLTGLLMESSALTAQLAFGEVLVAGTEYFEDDANIQLATDIVRAASHLKNVAIEHLDSLDPPTSLVAG